MCIAGSCSLAELRCPNRAILVSRHYYHPPTAPADNRRLNNIIIYAAYKNVVIVTVRLENKRRTSGCPLRKSGFGGSYGVRGLDVNRS